MTDVHAHRTVREFAAGIPGATRLFEKYGIDYCCGGEKPLGDVCSAKGVDVEAVLRSLQELDARKAEAESGEDYQNAPVSELIKHIVGTHHTFTADEIARLEPLFAKVCFKHGPNHPELLDMRKAFTDLAHELIPHMLKEEQVLFPYINELERAAKARQRRPIPFFATVTNPVRMMMMEHESAGELLARMRQLSNNYEIPEGACMSYQALLNGLQDLERDLHQHIHLENNILFPKAVEMEAEFE